MSAAESATERTRPYLLALVNGLPQCELKRRLFFMLQAAFDESVSDHPDLRGELFVIAGYAATIESWDAFSRKWENALHTFTNGEPFSMAEANRLWSEKLQRERVGYLQGLIEEHAEFGIALMVNPKALDFYAKGFVFDGIRKPHLFLLIHAITILFTSGVLRDRKVDFIFDRGRTKPAELMAAWEPLMMGAPHDARELIPKEPLFRANTEFIPLQAADLAAWWWRRRAEEDLLGIPRKTRVQTGGNIPFKVIKLDEEYLKAWRALNIEGVSTVSPFDQNEVILPSGFRVRFPD